MLNNIILKFLLKIFFNLSLKNTLVYSFNIFIPKFISNIKNNTILKFFKMNCFNMFNLRNKLNFNKSGRHLLNNKKKIGKARLSSSSSHVLRTGIVWYGLRKLSLYKYKVTKVLLNCLLIYNKYKISFMPLEIIKFIYGININSINVSNKLNNLLNLSKNNNIFINFLNNYLGTVNNHTSLNFIY